jgi:hypothetical protein
VRDLNAVASDPPPALGEIEWDGTGYGTDLLPETTVAVAKPLHRTPERPHEIETDFKSIEHLSLLSLSGFTLT